MRCGEGRSGGASGCDVGVVAERVTGGSLIFVLLQWLTSHDYSVHLINFKAMQ